MDMEVTGMVAMEVMVGTVGTVGTEVTEAMDTEAMGDTGATVTMAATAVAMGALAVLPTTEAKASTHNKDSTKASPDSTTDRSRMQSLLQRPASDQCWLTTSPDQEKCRSKSTSF